MNFLSKNKKPNPLKDAKNKHGMIKINALSHDNRMPCQMGAKANDRQA